MDKGLNELLKWGIENATTTENDPEAAPPTNRGFNPEAMAALFGGPSEAELMQAAMAVISAPTAVAVSGGEEAAEPAASETANGTTTSKDGPAAEAVTLENKLIAFDNLEQLVESLDNANLLARMDLWAPLLAVLDDALPDLRRMAAWCVGTAVQNNESCQERLLAHGGIPPLVRLATAADEPVAVRRKAVYALSSACRNYQPAMDACVDALATTTFAQPSADKVDATNMDAVDAIMDRLRDSFGQTAPSALSAAG